MKNIFDLLKSESITDPQLVDSFIVSAFVKANNISVNNNKFILSYLVCESSIYFSQYCDFLNRVKESIISFTLEHLIQMFEFVISPSDRIVSGAIYTPNYIREYIINTVSYRKKVKKSTFVDISCGCGGFLLTTAQVLKQKKNLDFKDIYENYLFGIDIKEYSINRTKILLSLNALLQGQDDSEYKFNLYVQDALIFKWQNVVDDFKGFDFIIGNPPYVCAKNLDENSKKNLKHWSVTNSGNTDLYIPFFQIAIENLKPNGLIGFITMNSFFKSLNARLLREYFKTLSLQMKIIDFGSEQVFKSKNTYTCLCLIKKSKQNHINYVRTNSQNLSEINEIDFHQVYYNNLNSHTGWNLQNHDLIEKIEATGKPFGEIFTTRHGIATLKNDIFIFKPCRSNESYHYLLDDENNEYPIEKGICRDIYNTNKLSSMQVAEELVQQIIFPYLTFNDKAVLIDEKELQTHFPQAYKYLKLNKDKLALRDKGKGNYAAWYSFGRTQSLQNLEYKLFFPKYSNSNPYFIINTDRSVKFYNGLALIGNSLKEIEFARLIMQTRLFWFYISSTGKPYSANYYSLNGNYIRNFGIYNFNEHEIDYLLSEKDINKINSYFEAKYEIDLNGLIGD
ncbi:N-6 DNA methylase [Psychrobacter sp. TB55-MNA-CIBAN-0194]|uniref:HsdM family class I SAM-dependent methyltransferase n=1 Tax=Psychrobacter sp. TB55-MNA-CIBAN-0194 TaxID=3140445 RepID=UPI00331F0890